MKIGIAHGSIVPRDAIGHDIMGMHDVLVESGFDVELIGDYFHPETQSRATAISVDEAIGRQDLSLLIYHHSIFWENGERLLRATRAARMMKYHNVTPAGFFADYSTHYASVCAAGREQTARLVGLFAGNDAFAADSAYNAAELAAAGASEVNVVPPFMAAAPAHRVRAMPTPPFTILFVGRPAPNKGHFDLLNVLAAYRAKIGPDIKLVLVGGYDQALASYRAEIDARIQALDLDDNVEFKGDIDADGLHGLFAESSAYLCLSEHEGFCVPIVEAQASGLPVISAGIAAVAETMGPGQLVVDPPRSVEDYVFIARLVHAVSTDPAVRRQVVANGYRNVLTRFSQPAIADRFMGSLAPILQRLA